MFRYIIMHSIYLYFNLNVIFYLFLGQVNLGSRPGMESDLCKSRSRVLLFVSLCYSRQHRCVPLWLSHAHNGLCARQYADESHQR